MTAVPVPVLFLPALLCNDELYRRVIDVLGGRIAPRVLVTSKPRIADNVSTILDQAPDVFALVGTSYGGTLAMEVALAAPKRVTSLWRMGCDPCAAPTGSPDISAALQVDPDAVIARLSQMAVHESAVAASASFRRMAHAVGAPAGANQAKALASRSDIRPHLRQLTMPVLLLWGENDLLVPVSSGQALARALPQSHFEQFADCGHLPALEKSAEAAALFGAFLRAR